MRVLMIASEISPYAQTGGLGEVMSALPAELAALGLEVDVLVPKYRTVTPESYDVERLDLSVEVDLNAKKVPAGFWSLEVSSGVRLLFLENDLYYDRDGLYGTLRRDYEDNAERFVFLTRAAIEMSLKTGVHYDIFHSHDWQAALTPVYLRTLFAGEPLLRASASIMTIHNLGYQGLFRHLDMPLVGVGWEYFNPGQMEFHGKLNFLKSGIIFADEVNTVSTGYRAEILTPEFGCGLEGVLQEKGSRLSGILNGVDYGVWNPVTDARLTAMYSPDDLSGKAACKADLQKFAELPVRSDTPLIGMVTRLSSQKGVDILEAALEDLLEGDVQFVILGTGERRYHDSLMELRSRYRDKMKVFLAFDDALAHRIFSASDMLLVPSRYEPCGLAQLYGLKYGAVPIVRATGGLNDTVENYDPEGDTGTGFKFTPADSQSLKDAVAWALSIYRSDPPAWRRLVGRGMTADFSWTRAAKEYARLYEKAVKERRDFAR